MSKKLKNVLIIALTAITLVGIVLGVWVYTTQNKFLNKKTIVLNNETQTKMEVNLTGIYPGMTTSYEINLKANKGDAFKITMNFEKLDTFSLAKFVDVEIKLQGERLDGGNLTEFLNGHQVNFPIEFDGVSELAIEITYSMGLDVGDEAQNTTADFNIVLSAKR